MSIIGTRPPLISETNFYELHHRARLAIKPGITGMWQVSGRSDITDFEEVVRLDKEYITDWNIGLDIKILFKYSSANNHLIVEMYAVGMSGIFFDYKPWEKLAFKILTEELPRQNYADGVNKEMSLHYQSFVMEAYGLLMIEMKHKD